MEFRKLPNNCFNSILISGWKGVGMVYSYVNSIAVMIVYRGVVLTLVDSGTHTNGLHRATARAQNNPRNTTKTIETALAPSRTRKNDREICTGRVLAHQHHNTIRGWRVKVPLVIRTGLERSSLTSNSRVMLLYPNDCSGAFLLRANTSPTTYLYHSTL